MNKRKEKFADMLIDIAKYVFTAGLLSMWFTDMKQWEWYSYVILLAGLVVGISGALYLYDDNNKDNPKKQ